MTARLKYPVILAGSIFALGFAFYAQFVNGYHPCELCLVQRYAYGVVIVVTLLALNTKSKFLKALVCLALLAEVGIAVYHTGIEHKWWEGLTTCSSSFKPGLSAEELQKAVMSAPAVRCDAATWFFLGASMATWNAIYAFVLFIISIIPCRKSTS